MPDTMTAQSERSSSGRIATAALFVVIDPASPGPGSRHLLHALDRVALGRGTAGIRRDARTLRVELVDRRVSTDHAAIERLIEGWVVRDLGSKNGVAIGGRRTVRHVLADGDWIELGQTLLRFRTLDVPADTAPDVVASTTTSLVPEIERVARRLAEVATSAVPVLLLGETGVGKEVAARALHARSGRSGAFVAINCAGLVDSIAGSTLFGHRRGAFTGAVEDRPGAFRAADGGTLLLDEVADLTPATQGALLRALQEREVVPVGDTRGHRVDVRVVAATLRDLDREASDGRFRIDLLARLDGTRLTLPPLRDRLEDLGMLVRACLDRHDAGNLRIASAAVAAMIRHRWPLNIRELDQAIASASTATRARIELEHLPEAIAAPPPEAMPPPTRRDELLALLATHRGNLAAVARALGTSRAHVHRLLRRFDVDRTAYR